jgi:hypothetical protein
MTHAHVHSRVLTSPPCNKENQLISCSCLELSFCRDRVTTKSRNYATHRRALIALKRLMSLLSIGSRTDGMRNAIAQPRMKGVMRFCISAALFVWFAMWAKRQLLSAGQTSCQFMSREEVTRIMTRNLLNRGNGVSSFMMSVTKGCHHVSYASIQLLLRLQRRSQ